MYENTDDTDQTDLHGFILLSVQSVFHFDFDCIGTQMARIGRISTDFFFYLCQSVFIRQNPCSILIVLGHRCHGLHGSSQISFVICANPCSILDVLEHRFHGLDGSSLISFFIVYNL